MENTQKIYTLHGGRKMTGDELTKFYRYNKNNGLSPVAGYFCIECNHEVSCNASYVCYNCKKEKENHNE